jgi:Domain of unknown function (DUF4129)
VSAPRRLAAVTALLVAALAVPAGARADAVSGAELAALGEQAAAGDASARERLLAVDEVDGLPVAVGDALAGARGKALARRARLIADSVQAAGGRHPPAADDRRAAQQLLDDRRFEGTDLPRPFTGALEWLGDRIQPVVDWIDDRGTKVPGGPIALWMALAGLVLLVAAGITSTTIRRRALAIERGRKAALPATEDPHQLERAADRAERDGDWELAVRLRFRAGLLRLDRRRVLVYRPSLTTGEVARATGSRAFAEIGERFDAIVYGGRPAERDDAEAAKRGWAAVLTEAVAR